MIWIAVHQWQLLKKLWCTLWWGVHCTCMYHFHTTDQRVQPVYMYICDLVWQKGLIAYLQVLKYDGFKFFKCCSLPMKAAMCIRFSHYLNQLLTFIIIHNTKIQQQSFPPFWIVFLTKVHYGLTACIRWVLPWVEVGAVGGQGYTLNKINWEGVRVKWA